MNQGRIWCVVHPTVGLPLLLGSVAATSLIVHACVLTHTDWFSRYWEGANRTRTSAVENPSKVASATTQAAPAFAITVSPVPGTPGRTDTAFVVTVTPNPAGNAATATTTMGVGDTVAHAPGPLALATPAAK